MLEDKVVGDTSTTHMWWYVDDSELLAQFSVLTYWCETYYEVYEGEQYSALSMKIIGYRKYGPIVVLRRVKFIR